MAFYTGYVVLPTNTYLAWKTAVAGNGYDADGSYGDQCWDLTAEFWHNVGFPTGYPLTGPNHYAYECWTVNKDNNISYNSTTYFELITSLDQVKQGDVVVFNGTSGNPAGHIGFADENYNPNKGGYIAILGQNQGSGGTPPAQVNPAGGTTANVKDLYVATDFLGAFRYIPWQQPTPPIVLRRGRFPWVLYARRLREKR
jgi:hypothetical protein